MTHNSFQINSKNPGRARDDGNYGRASSYKLLKKDKHIVGACTMMFAAFGEASAYFMSLQIVLILLECCFILFECSSLYRRYKFTEYMPCMEYMIHIRYKKYNVSKRYGKLSIDFHSFATCDSINLISWLLLKKRGLSFV